MDFALGALAAAIGGVIVLLGSHMLSGRTATSSVQRWTSPPPESGWTADAWSAVTNAVDLVAGLVAERTPYRPDDVRAAFQVWLWHLARQKCDLPRASQIVDIAWETANAAITQGIPYDVRAIKARSTREDLLGAPR